MYNEIFKDNINKKQNDESEIHPYKRGQID